MMVWFGIQRIQRRKCRLLSLAYYILRGTISGFVLGIVFNYNNWSCKWHSWSTKTHSEHTFDVDIPDDYRLNQPSPVKVISQDYKYTLKPEKIINQLKDGNGRFYIVIMVHLQAAQAKRRFQTRLSWGSVEEIAGKRIGIFFVITAGYNTVHDNLLAKENELYGDILQSNMPSSDQEYHPKRILSGYQWAVENIGNRSDYFVNIDGDMFVVLPNLVEYCLKMDKSDAKHLFHCGIHLSAPHYKPRNPASLYFVPSTVYSNKLYPAYCDSDMVIQSRELTERLYQTSLVTKIGPFPYGSAYVWGILREKLREGGQTNVISSTDFVKDDVSVIPLAHQLDYTNKRLSTDLVVMLWEKLRSRLKMNDDDTRGAGDKRLLKARLAKIPTTNQKKTPENDMKFFIMKWNRLPQKKF